MMNLTMIKMRRALFLGSVMIINHPVFSKAPPYNEKIRGIYENKIRQNAPPEKVFEIFATIKEEKSFYMTPSDFFRSVVPYNYSPNREEDLLETHESLVFRMADANGDGKMSFEEYMFFVILVSTNLPLMKQLFAEQNQVNLSGFIEIMKKAKSMNQIGQRTTDSAGIMDPRNTRFSEGEFELSCKTLYSILFPSREFITWDDFSELRELITEEILFYEFHQFELEEDGITAEDFLKSIACYVRTSKVEPYLKRINELEIKGNISFPEYLAFMSVIQQTKRLEGKLRLVTLSNQKKAVSRREFKEILVELCLNTGICRKYNLKITDLQIDLFFDLLDLDDSGVLEPSELFDVLVSRNSFGGEQITKPQIKNILDPIKVYVNRLLRNFGFRKIFDVEDPRVKMKQLAAQAKQE